MSEIEATQAIRDVENLLRDFISGTLQNVFGSNWIEKCGVVPMRIEKWKERKKVEEIRQVGGVVEPRLIYYADFYDIKTILKKHWGHFAPALGELKTIEVYLGELEKMRDANAHGRDLLPHQKQLANGVVGEIRTRLIRYRSKMETSEDYFPRIESVRDSLGNVWTPQTGQGENCFTKTILRPDDEIDFVIIASDPIGGALRFRMLEPSSRANYIEVLEWWEKGNTFLLKIRDFHIGKMFSVRFEIISERPHHAYGRFDDCVEFHYTVLPKKIE